MTAVYQECAVVRDPARAITWAPGRTIIYHSTGGGRQDAGAGAAGFAT